MNCKRKRQYCWPIQLFLAVAMFVFVLSACSSNQSEPATSVEPVTAEQPTIAEVSTTTEEADGSAPVEPNAAQESIVRLDDLSVELTPLVEGLNSPVFATHAGDGSGRLFVVEKAGLIRIVVDGQTLNEPFLDIRDRVGSNAYEQGLLGLAFSPEYAQDGQFFVNYTDKNGDTVISRFETTAVPDRADAASELVLLSIDQPARNHNGGMLAFGPDGNLYIGTGDGGGSFDQYGNGQNPATLLGKMLRIDVTSDTNAPYSIPADNPWVTDDLDGVDVLDEVWAIGLRNPWRFSFDRETGDLFIADVGQNLYEEVHLTPAGSPGGINYGWPILEGTHCIQKGCDTSGLELPILEYDHQGHCSITGGYVYRGTEYPGMNGTYFYGDFCSGTIWAAQADADGVWHSREIASIDGQINSFAEDEAGELYVIEMGGTIHSIEMAEGSANRQFPVWLTPLHV